MQCSIYNANFRHGCSSSAKKTPQGNRQDEAQVSLGAGRGAVGREVQSKLEYSLFDDREWRIRDSRPTSLWQSSSSEMAVAVLGATGQTMEGVPHTLRSGRQKPFCQDYQGRHWGWANRKVLDMQLAGRRSSLQLFPCPVQNLKKEDKDGSGGT